MRTYLKCLIGAIAIVIIAGGCGYNAMQQMEEQVFRTWSDVESNLQRRADLIPNLVATVKGFAAHEKETLQAVIEARAKATGTTISAANLGDAQAMQQLSEAQGGLTSALSRLMVVVERYPDLKADQNFLDLQNQLEGTENRINVARQRYNRAVESFNAKIRSLPYSLTNKLILHLERKVYFKADAGAAQAPKINFD